MEELLRVFTVMHEMSDQSTDEEALEKLTYNLTAGDLDLFQTKKGPETMAYLKRFGLVEPFKGQTKLDELDPKKVLLCLDAFRHYAEDLVKDQRRLSKASEELV